MKREDGSTLIELLLVVGIISILTAVSLPSILNARKTANEISAVASLRTLVAVNEQYRTRFQVYATKLAYLHGRSYVDRVLGSGWKSGYRFSYTGKRNSWSCSADPIDPGKTGDLHFFTDHTGVIYFSAHGGASPKDRPIDSTNRGTKKKRGS